MEPAADCTEKHTIEICLSLKTENVSFQLYILLQITHDDDYVMCPQSYSGGLCNRNKNLAIGNTSCISCAHNTLKASIGLHITPWPCRLRLFKGTGNGTIGWIKYDLLLVESFDVEYHRDLETWLSGHSRSLKVIPFKSLREVSYSPSIVISNNWPLAISEIFRVREWPDLQIWVWGGSRSLKMAQIDRPCMTFY